MAKSATLQYVKEWVYKNTPYDLLSTSYGKSKDLLILNCHKHGRFEVSFDNLKSKNTKCWKCGSESASLKMRKSIVLVSEWIKNNTVYKIVDLPYINRHSKIVLNCSAHGNFKTSIAFLQRGSGCGKCGRERTTLSSRKHTTESVKSFISKNTPYECAFDEFKNIKSKIDLRCNKHGIFSTSFDAIKAGKRCKNCMYLESRSEKECRDILESITGKKFIKTRPSFLINENTGKKLELDGYCEELSIAFEYDGEQHFKIMKHWNDGIDRLDKTKMNARVKDSLCEKNGICLIRIPYFVVNKPEYILNKLQSIGYTSNG